MFKSKLLQGACVAAFLASSSGVEAARQEGNSEPGPRKLPSSRARRNLLTFKFLLGLLKPCDPFAKPARHCPIATVTITEGCRSHLA